MKYATNTMNGNVMETAMLRVAYGGREVLKGVDVPISRGEVTAIVGPSGCGKTTFLRSLNRLTELTPGCQVTGRITIDGEDCLAMDPVLLRRRVGMVFQKPNPFPMSIRENVLYGVKAHGDKTGDHHDILEASLTKAVLWDEVKDRLDESALHLSGGQQQRVCIARSLATLPEVVLMDEPAGSLDPGSTAKLEESILAMRGDYTVVIVTHDVPQAHRVSDYLGFFYGGRVIEFGDTHRMFQSPREQATRDYLAGGLVTLPPAGNGEASTAMTLG
jgi:phosphate transport system ATP-binding protein